VIHIRARCALLFIVLLLSALSGCTSDGLKPTGSLTTASPTAGGVVRLPNDGRRQTAFEAYPAAYAKAKLWRSEAILYQIAVTRIMEINLGLPPSAPGWFFMFRVPDQTIEYYVKVVDGQVIGATETQPILAEKLPYKYLPIDLKRLTLDSRDVLRSYLEHGGEEYIATHPKMELDYRLVHLEGQPNPVWSLFDVSDLSQNAVPIFNVDAVTSDVTEDPFAPFSQ